MQDENAINSKMKGTIVSRAVAKSSKYYSNSSWDLVDAFKNNKVILNEIQEETLPKELQNLNEQEQIEFINKMAKQREDIQLKIKKLNETRNKYTASERLKKDKDKGKKDTLDSAIIEIIKKQTSEKGYTKDKNN